MSRSRHPRPRRKPELPWVQRAARAARVAERHVDFEETETANLRRVAGAIFGADEWVAVPDTRFLERGEWSRRGSTLPALGGLIYGEIAEAR